MNCMLISNKSTYLMLFPRIKKGSHNSSNLRENAISNYSKGWTESITPVSSSSDKKKSITYYQYITFEMSLNKVWYISTHRNIHCSQIKNRYHNNWPLKKCAEKFNFFLAHFGLFLTIFPIFLWQGCIDGPVFIMNISSYRNK